MSDLVMRHDIPNIGNMSEAYPHLIFHNFKSRLGERVSSVCIPVISTKTAMLNSKLIYLEALPCYTNFFLLQVMSILKYLYPVPREDSKRVLTFANHDDYISFRHHTYKKVLK